MIIKPYIITEEFILPIRLAVIMDPIQFCNIAKDSTLAMIEAAQNKHWQVFYIEQQNLLMDNATPKAYAQSVSIDLNKASDWYQLGEKTLIPLDTFNVILMRKDPPFDTNYIYSTYILEAAEQLGALVVNRPASLRDCNEKVFATHFPQCCPPLVISSQEAFLTGFLQQHEDVIFKPLDGMGGSSIFRCKIGDPNTSVILETLTAYGTVPIMGQKFLPQISDGDKRILLINGEPVPYALARIPKKGQTRGNLAAGGTGVAQPLSDRDLWICQQVGPDLKKRGLLFVGLDVIGDYLTEINVTSPTCIREIDKAYHTNIGSLLMDCIEEKLNLQ